MHNRNGISIIIRCLWISKTQVSYTPINYTLPYVRGCETLSVATSTDRGSTWIKSKKNPIIAGPPLDVEVMCKHQLSNLCVRFGITEP